MARRLLLQLLVLDVLAINDINSFGRAHVYQVSEKLQWWVRRILQLRHGTFASGGRQERVCSLLQLRSGTKIAS